MKDVFSGREGLRCNILDRSKSAGEGGFDSKTSTSGRGVSNLDKLSGHQSKNAAPNRRRDTTKILFARNRKSPKHLSGNISADTPWVSTDELHPTKSLQHMQSTRAESRDSNGRVYFHVGVDKENSTRGGPGTLSKRPRLVSIRSFRNLTTRHIKDNDLDDFSTFWSKKYVFMAKQQQSRDIVPNARFRRGVLSMVNLDMDRGTIARKWLSHDPATRNRLWEKMMLLALQRYPERALKALDVAILFCVPKIPRHRIEDCLDHLAAIYLERVKNPPPWHINMIYHLVYNFAKTSRVEDEEANSIPQRTVYWVLHHFDVEQVQTLYEVLCSQRIRIYPMTLLHFLARFMDQGELPLSIDVLERISKSGIDTSLDPVQSACVKLIRVHIGSNNNNSLPKELYRTRTYILAQILQMGICPAIAMYNAMLLNTIEASEYQLLMPFYKTIIENGLKPNRTTYAYLLRGVKESLDYDIFRVVAQDAEADGTLHRDPRLVCDLLEAIFKLEETTGQRVFFDKLLPTYKKYCDLSLLQSLGLTEALVDDPEAPDYPVMSPSPRTLGLMLIAYIKQYPTIRMWSIYKRYRRLVKQRHPQITVLAGTDHIANAFLMTFREQPRTLQKGTAVVKDMLEAFGSVNPANTQDSEAFKFAAPSVQTWSILLAGHIRHGQARAAEKILSMMRSRGLEPTQVTWNSLISGYAAMQDINSAVNTVQRMEAEDYSMDSYTLKGLGRFHNRARLLQALKDTLGDKLEAE